MPTPENLRLLDTEAVAASLGLHRKTIQKFARERRIASVRIGKKLKFRPADIEL
jgi:excisionase family DNA binding protein